MTFQGASVLSLDAKGRLGVPARYRDALLERCSGNLVLTSHPHRCLLIYPTLDWAPIRDQILAINGMGLATANLRRLLIGNAMDEVMDANGRVLIAPELRDWAKLDKQVRLMGLGDHFELWSEQVWQEQQAKAAEQFMSGDTPPGFENLAL
jgi:MraZ protein